jgi:hypothetical protein
MYRFRGNHYGLERRKKKRSLFANANLLGKEVIGMAQGVPGVIVH